MYLLKKLKRLHWALVTEESRKGHNQDWLRIPDYLYKLLTIGESVTEKTEAIFNQIKQHNDDD